MRTTSTNGALSMASAVFGYWFGIPAVQAALLTELWRRKGALVSADSLAEAVASTPGAVVYHICMLRKALDAEGLDTATPPADRKDNVGYSLTEVGVAELSNILRTANDELAAELAA